MSVSYWTESSRLPNPPSAGELPLHVDVCVVGAGIVGLTAALELTARGVDVLVVDADQLGRGVTGQSTAKVTVATGLQLDRVAERHGEEAAGEYVDAGRVGMDGIVGHVAEAHDQLGAAAPHDLFATALEGVECLEAHADLAQRLGLKVEQILGGAVAGALQTVRYPDQWMIQPTDYLHLLASKFVDRGGQLVLNCAVTSIRGGATSTVETAHGPVSAATVVAATHVPLGRVPSMLPWQQMRHHAVVFDTTDEVPMALDVDGGWSMRPIPGRGRRGIALGARHPVGQDDTEAAGALHRWVTTTLDAHIVDGWSSQDVFVDDHLPVVGRIGGADRVLTATGFGGWGLAMGTAAGIDLAQRAAEESERWRFWTLTSSRLARLAPAAAAQGTKDSGRMMLDGVTQSLSRKDADDLAPGQGVVVREGSDLVARSVGADGSTHAVSARCTHMGCVVAWNHEAQSWDCPCHGSRFSPAGDVLHGPAVEPLAAAPDH